MGPQDDQPARPGPRPAWRSVRSAVWSISAVLLVIAAVAVLLQHQSRGRGVSPVTGQRTPTTLAAPTPTTSARPSAAGMWSAVYYGSDGRLHLASLDGVRDVAGPVLPRPSGFTHSADVSPDGRYLAYVVGSAAGTQPEVVVVDLRRTTTDTAATITIPIFATRVYWSPDGTHLAFDSGWKGIHSFYVVSAGGDAPALIPGTDNNPNGNGSAARPAFTGLLGWLDSRHVVAVELPSSGAAISTSPRMASMAPGADPLAALESGDGGGPLVAVDIVTGAVRPLLADASLNISLVSPDGSLGWIFGGSPEAPSSPLQVVHLATGALQPLPNSEREAGSVWDAAAPSSTGTLLAVPVKPASGAGYRVAVINALTDSVSWLDAAGVPIAWSPDGRALLVTDTVPGWKSPGQDYTLSAVSPVAPGARQVRLTGSLVSFFGVVRS